MAEGDTYQAAGEPDLNYFVCTLGQADVINANKFRPWKTINEQLDHQAETCSDRPAVGFPLPSDSFDNNAQWGFVVYSTCPSDDFDHQF